MKKILKALTILIAVLLALSCVKEAEEVASTPSSEPQPCTLCIYRDGKFERAIDVTCWEEYEDVIHLSGYYYDSFCYYYPWRGEDSIDYQIDRAYLLVNGIVVGSPLTPGWCSRTSPKDTYYPWEDSILTTWVDLTQWNNPLFDWGPWDQYPNLKLVRVSVDCNYLHTTLRHFLSYIRLFIIHGRMVKSRIFYEQEGPPDSVDVYLYHSYFCDFYLKEHIEGINLKGIEIVGFEVITNLGLRFLRRAQDLRVLEFQSYRVNNFGLRHLKYLPNLRELSLDCPKVDNRGIRYLKKLTNLKVLYLESSTNIDSSGVAELRQSLPNCKVVKR